MLPAGSGANTGRRPHAALAGPELMRWIVDGMNVIATWPDGWWKDRHGVMVRLVDKLERSVVSSGDDVTVVFERRPSPPIASGLARLGRDEALDEIECGLCDLPPAVVDGERVAAVGHLHDLGHTWVAALPLVGGVRDRPRHRVILLAIDDQQRTAVRVLRVHLRLRP